MLDPTQSHLQTTKPPAELTTWTQGYGLIVNDNELQSASWLGVAIEKIKGFFGGEDRTLGVQSKIFTYINNHEKDVRSNGLLVLKLAQKGGIITASEVKDLDEKPEVHIDAEIQLLILKALKHLPEQIDQQSTDRLTNQVKSISSSSLPTAAQVYKNVISEPSLKSQSTDVEPKRVEKSSDHVDSSEEERDYQLKVPKNIHERSAEEKYEGEYKDGKMNGQGTYKWADGEEYVGEFENDKMNGRGVYKWDDSTYEGEFRDNKIEGKGKQTWNDGATYEGEYKNTEKSGYGVFTWLDGEKHMGEFENDLCNGHGIRTWADGSKYIGEFKDGLEDGEGIKTWANGDFYRGEFKNGEIFEEESFEEELTIEQMTQQGGIGINENATIEKTRSKIFPFYGWLKNTVDNFYKSSKS